MKKKLIGSIAVLAIVFFSSAYAQKKGDIKVVTTKRGENILGNILPPDYQSYKIRIQDTISKSSFDVNFFLEEYNKEDYKTENKVFYNSTNSIFICEVIPNIITEYNHLQIVFNTSEHTFSCYIIPKDNNNLKWKWNVFKGTPFEKNVPVLLIYQENTDDDLIEKKMSKLFNSLSDADFKNRKSLVEKIKSITNSFYILSYNVIIKN